MLVSPPTPNSLPINTANLPTESMETQNKQAQRIPAADVAYESSQFKPAQSEQELNDADRTARNAELREQLFYNKTKPGNGQQSNTAETNKGQEIQDNHQKNQEQLTISKLESIDRKVRAHERAHASAGGVHAGIPSYTFQTGPNGVRYAVGGEVPIDISPVPGNPEATLEKARIIARAALAPIDPSSTDRRVAAAAQSMAAKAQFEISRMAAEKLKASQGNIEVTIDGEPVEEEEEIVTSGTTYGGQQLRAALATDATEQVGGQVSASA